MNANLRIRTALLTSAAAMLCAAPAFAQSYDSYSEDLSVTPLGEAQVYDEGLIFQGSSDPTQWNGTSMSVAMAVIAAAPDNSLSPATEDLVARTLLSGGVPPQGAEDNADYFEARLSKLVALGRTDEVNAIMGRLPGQSETPQGQRVEANKLLTLGQIDEACELADRAEEARAEPYWAKLRAFCHVKRGEIPAAELTADVLRRSGHEAPQFYKALRATSGISLSSSVETGGDALLSAMVAFSGGEGADAPKDDAQSTLAALISEASSITQQDFGSRLAALSLTAEGSDVDGGFFDVDQVIADNSPASWGQLYGVVKSGTDASISAKAAGALLRRAQEADIFYPVAKLIVDDLSVIPHNLRAQADSESFARLAVFQGDLGMIQALYNETGNDDHFKTRLALASDALGNGFLLGELGNDMTARVQSTGAKKRRAVRDSFIAVGLGASLSDDAAIVLSDMRSSLSGRQAPAGALLALRSAAAKGARAETALRAASLLGETGPQGLRADSLSSILSALMQAGLTDMAGRIAAEDFLSWR